MKITKFVHSCLLVETDDRTILIDPGIYSWDSHLLHVAALRRLDYIVITHEHPDHYHAPFVKTLSDKFPHAPLITNRGLADKIKEEGLPNKIVTGSEDGLQVFEAEHEPLPLDQPVPLNIGVHIEEALTHPGDAWHINHARDILALPITAPWGSFKQSLERVIELKPKMVVPLHDYHWHKAARQEHYGWAAKLLAPHDIKFIALENANPVEL